MLLISSDSKSLQDSRIVNFLAFTLESIPRNQKSNNHDLYPCNIFEEDNNLQRLKNRTFLFGNLKFAKE